MAEKGWIKLHRKLLDCWIWQVKPYDKARAWVDLLLLTMHHDKKIIIDDKPVVISRGSYFISRGKLADRWGWSIKKVDAYLKALENENMVTTTRTKKGTTITIVNYSEYQVEGTTQDITEDTIQGTTLDTTVGITVDTTVDTQNKNIKNIKNVKELKNNKNNIGRFTPPDVIEVQAYCYERNNKIDAQAFVDFYESKGWMVGKNKMKDWKAAVRTWERSNTTSKPKVQSQPQRSSQLDDLLNKIREEEQNDS